MYISLTQTNKVYTLWYGKRVESCTVLANTGAWKLRGPCIKANLYFYIYILP